jgi:hypothetical protein
MKQTTGHCTAMFAYCGGSEKILNECSLFHSYVMSQFTVKLNWCIMEKTRTVNCYYLIYGQKYSNKHGRYCTIT